MSKIRIENIQDVLNPEGWILISEKYENLDSELIFECPKGHRVFSSWKKMRDIRRCPQCEQAALRNTDAKILPKGRGVKRILALDQATKSTGWSVYDNGQLVKYGTFETTLSDEIARCDQVRQWLISMLLNWRPDYVALEDIQFQEQSDGRRMGVTVFQTLAHLQGILMETCYENKVDFSLCPTNTWRHFCGVKGKTRTDRKRSMRLLAKDWFNVDVSEDEADAIGIGYYFAKNMMKSITVENWE